jgi:hypothetical protein
MKPSVDKFMVARMAQDKYFFIVRTSSAYKSCKRAWVSIVGRRGGKSLYRADHKVPLPKLEMPIAINNIMVIKECISPV